MFKNRAVSIKVRIMRTLATALLLLLVCSVWNDQLVTEVFAQTSGRANLTQTLNAKVAEAESYLEERLNKRLEALAEPPYFTNIKVDFPVKKLNALRKNAGGNLSRFSRGALSKGVSNDDALISLLNALTPVEILQNAGKITVTVTLDLSYPKDSVAEMQKSLFASLRLYAKRGDKVEIVQKDLTAGRAKFKIERAERESQQFKNQVDVLQRELEAVRRKEADAQREIAELRRKEQDAQLQMRDAQKLSEDSKNRIRDEQEKATKAEEERRKIVLENEDLKKQIGELNQKNKDLLDDSKTLQGKARRFMAGIELPLTVIPSVLLALAGVLVIVLFQTSRVKSASNEMNATMLQVSSAVAKIGESIVQAAKVQGKQGADAINVGPGGALGGQNQLQGGGDSNSEELLALEKEAQGLLADLSKTRYTMLSVLKDWLADKREGAKFVAFSEAMGPNAAREIWKAFPKEDLELLGNALFEPMAKVQAYKVVLQLYRLVGREISRKPNYFTNLDLIFLISATDVELSGALSESGTVEAARVMILLTPERCSRIIPGLRNHDSTEFIEAMREATNMSEQDARDAIEHVRGNIRSEREQGNFDVANHIMVMLDAPNPEFRTAASRFLRSDKSLSASMGSRVVTIDEVLNLEDETLAELLTELEPSEVGALIVSLPEENGDRVNQFFSSPKIQAAIRQELDKYNRSKTARKRAEMDGQKIQASLILQVKEMREQGLIELADDGGYDDEDGGDEGEEEAS